MNKRSIHAKAKPFKLNKMCIHAKAKPFKFHSMVRSIVFMALVSTCWMMYIIGAHVQLSAINPTNTTVLQETESNNLTNTKIQETTRRSPILPKPLAWCTDAKEASKIGISVGTNVLNQFHADPAQNWGNVLSPYWAGRAMAELGGYDYNGKRNNFGQGTWMEFLPKSAPARVPNKDVFDKVCNRCKSYLYFNILSCIDGWSHIAPEIMNNTQEALSKHSNRVAKEEKDAIFNFFKPNDWLIYNRCCIFGHPMHAPGVLRTYDAIPTDGEFNVFIMMGRKEDRFNLCDDISSESIEYMKKRNPLINVTILESSTLYVDFSRLVFAPNVLVAATGSSWALWSALISNSNNVVSHLPSLKMSTNDTLLLPTTVQWLVDVPTMPNPEVSEEGAKAMGLQVGQRFSNTPEDRKKVMRYFRES
jgi:hypothetical protein